MLPIVGRRDAAKSRRPLRLYHIFGGWKGRTPLFLSGELSHHAADISGQKLRRLIPETISQIICREGRLRMEEQMGDRRQRVLVLFNAFTIFLPFCVCAATVALSAVYLLLRSGGRCALCRLPHVGWLAVWAAAALAAGIAHGNALGCAALLAVLLSAVYSLLCALGMETHLRDALVRLIAISSACAAPVALAERLMTGGRASATFFNPNYYGYVCELSILVCLYGACVFSRGRWLYLAGAALNAVGIALAGSYFSWLAAWAGALVFFFCRGNRRVFLCGVCVTAAYGLSLLFFPFMLPKTADFTQNVACRLKIWKMTLAALPDAPLFGRGMLAFVSISGGLDKAMRAHAHNLILDLLLDFGAVGTALLGVPAALFIRRLVKTAKSEPAAPLALAALAATFVHGMIDVPIAGFQASALLFLLLSLAGAAGKAPE